MTAAGASPTLVAGFGVTGRAVARALVERGQDVIVVEDHPDADGRALAASMGLSLVAATDHDELRPIVGRCGQLVPSPGIPPRHPVFELAAEHGVPVRSEIELAWQLLVAERGSSRPILAAITGTNGKTTVTTLVVAILAASGLQAESAGNIGRPLIEVVTDRSLPDVIVVEVSSFQLAYTDRFRPAVSCWLNLAPDHLDWHPTLTDYAAAKARIWAQQGPGDTAVVNADDPAVMAAAASLPDGVTRSTFGRCASADYRPSGDTVAGPPALVGPDGGTLIALDALPRTLPHDQLNAAAAAAVSIAAGGSAGAVAAGLTGAAGLPHRVELVAAAGHVSWYDDSKATTPASVLAACAGMQSVVLIAGGRNKGLDLGVLAAAVPPVHAVVAIGEAAAEVRAVFAGRVPVADAPSMVEAVRAAAALAEPGDAVLLSPGGTSFDWYRSYAARGDDFAARVRDHLAQREAPTC